MPQINLNEIFDLEIRVKEKNKKELDGILSDNGYRSIYNPCHTNRELIYFQVYNVGILQCAIIRKLILDAKIMTY